jgi:hypothetical protein
VHTAAFCIVDGPVVCFALDACLHLEGLRYDEQQEKACWASAAIPVGAGLAVLGCVPPGLCSTSTESHVLVRAQGQAAGQGSGGGAQQAAVQFHCVPVAFEDQNGTFPCAYLPEHLAPLVQCACVRPASTVFESG